MRDTNMIACKRLAQSAAAVGAVAAVFALTGGVANAATPRADVAAAANVAVPACAYVVRYDGLAVRENPSPDSVARKTKPYGSIVNGPCVNHQHSSGEWYTAVFCDCATDGEGWMRTAYLDRVSR
jgi:hypothetical protein